MLQLPLNLSLDQAATFQNYMPDGNEELLFQLNERLSDGGQLVFVYGQNGAGKTHLAQAISLEQDKVGRSAAYLPLSNEMMAPAMLAGLNQFSTVVADDFHCIAGQPAWQQAFFNLYNELKDAGNNLVIFSSEAVSALDIALADLVSRLSAMNVYHLKSLAGDSISVFIRWRGKKMGLAISEDVAAYIQNRISRDADSAIHALNELDKASLAEQRKLTIPFVKKVLAI